MTCTLSCAVLRYAHIVIVPDSFCRNELFVAVAVSSVAWVKNIVL